MSESWPVFSSLKSHTFEISLLQLASFDYCPMLLWYWVFTYTKKALTSIYKTNEKKSQKIQIRMWLWWALYAVHIEEESEKKQRVSKTSKNFDRNFKSECFFSVSLSLPLLFRSWNRIVIVCLRRSHRYLSSQFMGCFSFYCITARVCLYVFRCIKVLFSASIRFKGIFLMHILCEHCMLIME